MSEPVIYPINVGDGRSTEDLVEAGEYGYAHSCITSEHFPVRAGVRTGTRELTLIELERAMMSEEVIAEAVRRGLERPVYEDALYFGSQYPDVQRAAPIVFLHDPWLGLFGRLDVVCLWSNAGRRELGLEDFDREWSRGYRFAFVRSAR